MVDLSRLFTPKSIAVVGASRTPGKVGHDVLKNLMGCGFEGALYPVNPKSDEVLGLTCYPSVSDIPGDIDLVVVVIPAKFVVSTMRECAAKNVGAAIVIAAGFREAGEEGARLEQEMLAICREAGIRVVGPNCLGVLDAHSKLNASFADGMVEKGNIAFISQSGAFGTAIIDWAIGAHVGFSKFISIGNKADLDETSLIGALAEDEQTDVIMGYLESVKDGVGFLDAARRATAKKPVVVLKVGVTAAGAKAASSHTGALAGSETALSAAFEKAGIIRARIVEEFFDYAVAFGLQGAMKGANIAVVTNAGGPGVVVTDAVEESCLSMARLDRATEDELARVLPTAASTRNPVDVLGDAGPDRYEAALKLVDADPNVDAIVVLITPQTMTDISATAQAIADLSAATSKPVMAALMGGRRMFEGTNFLVEHGVPTFPYPERAVKCLATMCEYGQARQRPAAEPTTYDVQRDAVQRVIDNALAEGRDELGEIECRRIVAAYGFRVPRCIEAATEDAAAAAANELGYPSVLKISSPDILHKSDVGGVKINLPDEAAVRAAFNQIMESARKAEPEADLTGVLVQEMLLGGKEVILGMNRDPQFGPLIMFGLGGIYVEVLKDVAFRLAPLAMEEAREMTDDVRSAALLKGVRGEAPSDLNAVVEGLCRLSQLVTDFPRIAELDVNPLKVFGEGEGAVAIDARLRLSTE